MVSLRFCIRIFLSSVPHKNSPQYRNRFSGQLWCLLWTPNPAISAGTSSLKTFRKNNQGYSLVLETSFLYPKFCSWNLLISVLSNFLLLNASCCNFSPLYYASTKDKTGPEDASCRKIINWLMTKRGRAILSMGSSAILWELQCLHSSLRDGNPAALLNPRNFNKKKSKMSWPEGFMWFSPCNICSLSPPHCFCFQPWWRCSAMHTSVLLAGFK